MNETDECRVAANAFKVPGVSGGADASVKMTNKKLCFFGDTNKVIVLDLHEETWTIKTINKPNYEFLYYAAAVTLPNGDALITGGGSS